MIVLRISPADFSLFLAASSPQHARNILTTTYIEMKPRSPTVINNNQSYISIGFFVLSCKCFYMGAIIVIVVFLW